MPMEDKVRTTTSSIIGDRIWANSGSPTQYNTLIDVAQQRTSTQDSIWPWIRSNWNDPKWPKHIRSFWHRQDWGNPFITEKGSIRSSLNSVHLSGRYLSTDWRINSEGPVLLAGFSDPMPLASSDELVNENAIMFALGGTGINRTRPGKPEIDLATTLGELRFGGLPQMLGNSWKRAYDLRTLARETGNEYLNLQFGWAPIFRDLEGLAKVVLQTRNLLLEHEKQLDKLLTRGCEFNDTIETSVGLTKASNMANYDLLAATPYGSSVSLLRTNHSVVPPVEITRVVTKSYFRAGYRFYYPDIQTALTDLQEFEAQANLLLGTRLDPEVLWNLQPWTWLIDYVVNFGDVLGNLSAIISDGLVMQYAYIMREVEIDKEIYFPRGLFVRSQSSGYIPTGQPFSVHTRYHRKMRAKASPFGFGLTYEDFTPSQLAILAALGISRGLK
jgi:hypothetical protein